MAQAPSSPPVADANGLYHDGGWVYGASRSALDGKANAMAFLNSTNRLVRPIGADQPARLAIRCASTSGLAILMQWPLFMGSGKTSIRYRLDDGPIEPADWDVTEDGMAIGLFLDNQVTRAFLAKLRAAKRLVVEASPYHSAPVEVTFDLGPVAARTDAVLEACS